MTQSEIVANLKELSKLESDKFKKRAYAIAASAISGLTEEDFSKDESFTYITGIGKAINTKILDMRDKDIIPSKLVELRKIADETGKVDESLYKVREGFTTKRIPYDEATKFVDELSKLAESVGSEVYFLGSWRRRKPMIADIDILAVGEVSYSKFVSELGKKYEVLVSGSRKTSFVMPNEERTQIDVTLCQPEHFVFSVLHFTGSADHNVKLRRIAKDKGYSLSQYGLKNIETKEYVQGIYTEKDIFDFLGEAYVEPENR